MLQNAVTIFYFRLLADYFFFGTVATKISHSGEWKNALWHTSLLK